MVVVGGACYRCIQLPLALMLVLTFVPCALTFDTNTPFEYVVVSLIANCAGGDFSFSHWHKYSTCTRGGIFLPTTDESSQNV